MGSEMCIRDRRQIAPGALHAAAEVAPELEPWVETFVPEMALVNYYPPGSAMGMHVDDSEESPAPVISLSIGDEALFRPERWRGKSWSPRTWGASSGWLTRHH